MIRLLIGTHSVRLDVSKKEYLLDLLCLLWDGLHVHILEGRQ